MLMDIPHYPQLVERLAVTLKPRGLMILVESSMSFVGCLWRRRDIDAT